MRLLLAIAIISAVAGLTVVSVVRLPRETGQQSTAPDERKSTDLELRSVKFTETAEGETRWTLLAETANYDMQRHLVELKGVSLKAAPMDRKVGELFLTSPSASYNTETQEVSLSGGVNAKSESGMKFSTEAARFYGKTGLLTTSHPVSFSDGTISVKGVGMDFLTQTSKVRLKSNVTADYAAGAQH